MLPAFSRAGLLLCRHSNTSMPRARDPQTFKPRASPSPPLGGQTLQCRPTTAAQTPVPLLPPPPALFKNVQAFPGRHPPRQDSDCCEAGCCHSGVGELSSEQGSFPANNAVVRCLWSRTPVLSPPSPQQHSAPLNERETPQWRRTPIFHRLRLQQRAIATGILIL